MDKLSPQQRHANMAAIHAKDTKPEMIVRRGLWSRGFRYRLNHKRLPGHPDLVLRKYKTCIFINGCFWHGHNVTLPEMDNGDWRINNSACCKIPKTNTEFWVKKIKRNQERDLEVKHQLNAMGWNCITIWECELKSAKREATLDSLAYTLNEIFLQDKRVKMYGEQETQPFIAADDGSDYK
ncbi:MAG: DNA mismatch endonuclease Vsr [Bacteroidaceae bacterium]|nr:DNA mismatch endonuclease Vsr [Bacteroidaceae bacterium]